MNAKNRKLILVIIIIIMTIIKYFETINSVAFKTI